MVFHPFARIVAKDSPTGQQSTAGSLLGGSKEHHQQSGAQFGLQGDQAALNDGGFPVGFVLVKV